MRMVICVAVTLLMANCDVSRCDSRELQSAEYRVVADDVSFVVPRVLAEHISVERVPAEENEGFDWGGPAHLKFTLVRSYADRAPKRHDSPTVRVFVAADFLRLDPSASETLKRLRSLLLDPKDRRDDGVPVLPEVNAAQLFTAKEVLLESEALKGIGFVTAYAQDETAVSNKRAEWVFSGMSRDRRHYVIVNLPLFVPGEHEKAWLDEYRRIRQSAGDRKNFAAGYRSYIGFVTRTLQSLPETDLQPNLPAVYRMIKSIRFEPVGPK